MDGEMSVGRGEANGATADAQIYRVPIHRDAVADQIGHLPRRCQRLHLHRSVQADPCQAGHRPDQQLANGTVCPADGSHQRDDGCASCRQRTECPQTQGLGPFKTRHLQR